MKRIILFLMSLSLPVAIAHSAEGDLFKEGENCFVELADGTEESTPCPTYEPEILSESDVQASIDLFAKFEKSKMAKEVKSASLSQGQMSNQALNERFSQEVRDKAELVKDGRYIASVTFLNKENYPSKGMDNRRYYHEENDRTEYMDNTYAAQWDNIILSKLVGANHKKYSANVEYVSDGYVNIQFFVDNSNQLKSILQNKPIHSINHVGSPKIELDEIRLS